MKLYAGTDYLRTLYVRTSSPQSVLTVTDEVRQMLEARHRRGVAYNVENLSAILDSARNICRALTAVLMIVGCIALVVSGVGIMNIMFVTVTERTWEIGLRKAVGARRREILYQFRCPETCRAKAYWSLGFQRLSWSRKAVLEPAAKFAVRSGDIAEQIFSAQNDNPPTCFADNATAVEVRSALWKNPPWSRGIQLTRENDAYRYRASS